MKDTKIIYYFYAVCYMFSFVSYLYLGKIDGDLRGEILQNHLYLFVAFLISIISFLFFISIINIIQEKLKTPVILKISKDNKIIHWVILFLNIGFYFFCYFYNFDISGNVEIKNTPVYLLYFFIIIQPLYLTCFYFCIFIDSKNKIYTLNLIVFIICYVLKGWLIGILYIFIIGIIRYKEYIRNNKRKLFFYILFLLLLAPILKFTKEVMMLYMLDKNSSIYDLILLRLDYMGVTSFLDFIFIYMSKIVGRFEHISIVYYTIVHSFNINNVNNFLFEGWINDRILSSLGYVTNKESIQSYLAYTIEPLYHWQVQVPLPARIILYGLNSIFYLIYNLILILITIFLSKIIINNKAMKAMICFMLFILLYHGWLYSVILLIQALIITNLFLLFLRFLRLK